MYHITKNYALKFIYDDENECINDKLSRVNPFYLFKRLVTPFLLEVNNGQSDS